MRHYTGTEAQTLALDAAITANCGWPSNGTVRWAIPKETAVKGVYAIEVPRGSHGFAKNRMIQGIEVQEAANVEFPAFEEV